MAPQGVSDVIVPLDALPQEMLDYQSYYATLFYLQCNGQAEHTVQSVKLLLCMATLKGLNWFNVLAVAELSTNSAPLSYSRMFSFRLNCSFYSSAFPDVYNLD